MKPVEEVRPMTDEEMERLGWENHRYSPPVMVMENGEKFFPSADAEGNGPGALFGFNEDDETIMVIAE